jgi:hypothetical protein
MWHTTQGTSIEGAVTSYSAYPPQLIVDPFKKRKVQHISLANAGYALWNEDVDDSRCVQIEVVGYAEQAKNWPDEVYEWLGQEVARPLHEHFGVPYVAVWKGFKGPEDVNYTLASASSPLRLTQQEIDSFSGHLAHQHVPGDNHWDAPFRMDKLLAYAEGNDFMTGVREPLVTVNGMTLSMAQAIHLMAVFIQAVAPGTHLDPDGNPVLGDIFGAPLFTDNPGTPQQQTVRLRQFYAEQRAKAVADVDEVRLAAELHRLGVDGVSAADVKAAVKSALREGTGSTPA